MTFGKNTSPKSVSELTKHGVIASLEPGAEFEGKIKFGAGTARINSHFKGEITGEGNLIVAECGELDAEVHVAAISVTGKVKGSIHATDRIEIKERGVILGDIYTPVLVVEPGGYLDGQCHMPAQEAQNIRVTADHDKDAPA
ncbi:MAG: bactofilin family protein [Terriglobia bacterium]